jgi:hypothetical protein
MAKSEKQIPEISFDFANCCPLGKSYLYEEVLADRLNISSIVVHVQSCEQCTAAMNPQIKALRGKIIPLLPLLIRG